MKKQVNLNLNYEIYLKVQRHYPNKVSQLVEDYFRLVISERERDVDGINELQLETELKAKLDDVSALQANIVELRKTLEFIQKNREKQQQLALEQEKQRVEAMKTCSSCKSVVDSHTKIYKVHNKLYCKGCYQSF